MLSGVLTLNISTIGEMSIFRSGWVIRIMPHTHFSPPLSVHSYYFLKNRKYKVKKEENLHIRVQFIIGKRKWQWRKKVDIGHDSNDPSRPKIEVSPMVEMLRVKTSLSTLVPIFSVFKSIWFFKIQSWIKHEYLP